MALHLKDNQCHASKSSLSADDTTQLGCKPFKDGSPGIVPAFVPDDRKGHFWIAWIKIPDTIQLLVRDGPLMRWPPSHRPIVLYTLKEGRVNKKA